MSCPTCGCSCCQPIDIGHMGFIDTPIFFGRDRMLVVDLAEPERPLAEAIEMIARKAMAYGDDDGRPFHQRLNRKPWERRA